MHVIITLYTKQSVLILFLEKPQVHLWSPQIYDLCGKMYMSSLVLQKVSIMVFELQISCEYRLSIASAIYETIMIMFKKNTQLANLLVDG